MRPVYQDAFGELGNCFSACLASVFECELADVPNFFVTAGNDADAWWAAVRDWLAPRGFGVMSLSLSDDALLAKFAGFFIVSGQTSSGTHHATVWCGGKLVHDPMPGNSLDIEPNSVDLIYPLDPSALRLCDG